MAFKMKGYSGFTKKSAYHKSASKTDENIKQQLLDQLSSMKDPMESNRGKAIARKLINDFGMSGDELDSIVGQG
tara:strand:- start:187 stop:408 length:222 start_codon:yes stop_codon:yes gene_type:complete